MTSSFEFFPGVPIFHSRDLVNWRQLGHVLDRPSQLPLEGAKASDGIYAPTLRHGLGRFWIITTILWLWHWQRGADEALATCRVACDLLDDYFE